MNDKRTIDCPGCETQVVFKRASLPKWFTCPDCGEVIYANKYTAREVAAIFRRANSPLHRLITRLKGWMK